MGPYATAISDAAAKAGVGDADEVKDAAAKVSDSKEPVKGREAKAEPYHPLLGDVSLEGLTDAQKAAVLDKVKAYDRNFHKENTAFQAYKKFQDLYRSNAAFAKDVDATIGKHTGKATEPEEAIPKAIQTALSKRIDQLLAKATTADERETVREARQIIAEETADSREALEKALKRIDKLEQELGQSRTERTSSRLEVFNKELDALEAKFSFSLIEKYRTTLQDWSVKYPTKTAEWILYKLAEPEELEEAKVPAGKKKSTTSRPAASVTAEPDTLDRKEFKAGGKTNRWDLGKAFRTLSAQKS